jgi:endonuclease G, mitochondrial
MSNFLVATNFLKKQGFALSYDTRTRNAQWVVELLTPDKLSQRTANRDGAQFQEDSAVHPMFRAHLSDYAGSGYDRGHLVPAADAKFSPDAMKDTFFLTNISPQVGTGFNRDYWSRMEQFVRNLVSENQEVFVFTGPAFVPKKEGSKHIVRYEVIGNPPNVAVPTHFFKVILARKDSNFSLGAFLIPNEPISESTPVERFATSVEMVERLAGVQFFEHVNRKLATPLCQKNACILPPPNFHKKKSSKVAE